MSDKKPFPESLNTPPPGLVLHKTSKVKFDGIKQGEVSNDTPLEALEKSISNSIQAVRRGAEITRIAFEEDPKNRRSVGVWKRKSNWQIPDHVIKRIAMSDDLVAAIVQARSMFLSPFGKELKDRFSIGYRIEPNRGVTQDWSPEKKEELQERIKKVSAIIGTCGYTEGFDHDERLGLDSFLYQQVANGIKYGRFATEIIWVTQPNGEQTFQAFRPVDAATIYAAMPREDSQGEAIRNRALYLLEQVTGRELTPEREAERDYAWYQVVNDQAIQAFTHNEMFVHQFYPTTDVELMGYPMTPLDACIAAVTTHMNITTHNKLYFQNGRAARGMVVFQSDDVDQAVIDAVRQHFQATANSVSASFRVPVIAVGANDKVMWQPIEAQGGRDMEFQYLSDSNARSILTSFMMSPEELPGMAHLSRGSNSQTLSECLHPLTRVITPNGLISVGEILGGASTQETAIWTGKEWANGRVFRSGLKQLKKTVLVNGSEIMTSPDHKFLVIGEKGTPVWKVQAELSIGDLVLVNSKPVPQENPIPQYKGKELTIEMMELLGWATGDGSFVAPKKRAGASIHFFYHQDKEPRIWESHFETLVSFGVNTAHKKIHVSEEEREKIKTRYGFKSCASTRLKNIIYDTDFYRWLESLGFTSSKEGKTIPAMIFSLPEEYRAAFLRGLFSADGHRINKSSAAVTIQDDKQRDMVRQLLLSLGIRTLKCKGMSKELHPSFDGDSDFSYKLYIKDRQKFWGKIGFLQPHKQLLGAGHKFWVNGELPYSVVSLLAKKCEQSPKFNTLAKKYRDYVKGWIRGNTNPSKQLIRQLMEMCDVNVDWFEDYSFEEVSELHDLNQQIEMLDVEIFDNTHAFMAEGMIVHNSSNEYQLIAARDTGLRPLIGHFQTFINEKILPLLDPTLAKLCTLKFYGLDSDSAEKESTRLQEDMPLHGTYDEMLERVEKDPIGREWGGEFPFNASYQQILFQHFTVGEIKAHFFNRPEALKDPALAYIRDPMWFQWQQLQMQAQQVQAQQQQMQAQAQQAQPGQEAQGQPTDPQAQGQEQQQEQEQPTEDSAGGDAQQMEQELSKAESQLEPAQRRVLQQHKRTVKNVMASWKKEARSALNKIVAETKKV